MNVYLPKRIKRCPQCGDSDQVQYVVEGMGPAPSPAEEERIYFKGCLIDTDEEEAGPRLEWYCPEDNLFYA